MIPQLRTFSIYKKAKNKNLSACHRSYKNENICLMKAQNSIINHQSLKEAQKHKFLKGNLEII